MTHRSDRIKIAADAVLCTALSWGCADKQRCARYMAALPTSCRPVMGDFTLTGPRAQITCGSFIAIETSKTAAPVDGPTRRKHEAPEGIV